MRELIRFAFRYDHAQVQRALADQDWPEVRAKMDAFIEQHKDELRRRQRDSVYPWGLPCP